MLRLELDKDGYNEKLSPATKIIDRIFTEKNSENKNYQTLFNNYYSPEEAEAELQKWLEEFGFSEEARASIKEGSRSQEIEDIIKKNNDIVVNNIHAKGIPTMIYNGKKHTGAYKED